MFIVENISQKNNKKKKNIRNPQKFCHKKVSRDIRTNNEPYLGPAAPLHNSVSHLQNYFTQKYLSHDRTCRCCTSDLGTSEHCSRETPPGMGLASTLSAWEHQGVRRRQGWWGRVSWALLWSPGHSLDHCSWVVSGDVHLPVGVHCRLGGEIWPDHRDYEHWETCCRRYQSWTLPCWGASGSLSYTSTTQTEILLWRWEF